MGCQKNLNSNQTPAGSNPNDSSGVAIAPVGFNYATSKTLTVSVSTLTTDNKPIGAASIHIYTLNASGLGQLVYTGSTGSGGSLTTQVTVPTSCDTLVVDPAYVGLIRLAKVAINSTSVNCILGGPNGFGGDVSGALNSGSNLSSTVATGINGKNTATGLTPDGYSYRTSTKFVYMGSYDNYGRPKYLVSPSDVISSDLLADLNASLPEQVDVRTLHPQYISSGSASDIVITQKADVWLTFTYEGAGNQNAMGWYKYPTGNPPATINDIDTIHYAFPNCSLLGSGGNMRQGDKIKIGTFDPGTTIGLVLFGNGWNQGSVNPYTSNLFFTDSYLNPETDPTLQRHTVLLQYQNQYLIGFEDLNRQSPSCDHDFNDVVVYATSNPITAISQNDVQKVAVPNDSDGDGVPDAQDAFPNDPTRAYINYFPSQNTWGTLAYEDLWPNTGDYDLNDLVVSYRYKFITNADNKTVEFYADYAPVAAGARFYNGFGVQFPFSPDLIKTVTGQSTRNTLITLNANGTEAGQSKAVIIPFDNYANMIGNGANMINTYMSQPKVSGDTSHIYVLFNAPVDASTLGTAPFNPFAISNGRRGYEVHLPNMAPTDLASTSLFGTIQDASVPASQIYYVTRDNHPFGLSFLTPFNYPTEGVNISNAYLHFLEWAGSGGNLYPDWYSNTSAGYRNTSNIYTK